MAWFSYHAKAKNLIKNRHLTKVEFVSNWNGISPAMVLFFDCDKPMPIRNYRWLEYEMLFDALPKQYLQTIKFIGKN